jgi:hypothetical protein
VWCGVTCLKGCGCSRLELHKLRGAEGAEGEKGEETEMLEVRGTRLKPAAGAGPELSTLPEGFAWPSILPLSLIVTRGAHPVKEEDSDQEAGMAEVPSLPCPNPR